MDMYHPCHQVFQLSLQHIIQLLNPRLIKGMSHPSHQVLIKERHQLGRLLFLCQVLQVYNFLMLVLLSDIWCALMHSIYMNKPFLSFSFSFRNFKLMNCVGSSIFITAVPAVSPIGAMPQNSSATHPDMPGESPSTLSGSTLREKLRIYFHL